MCSRYERTDHIATPMCYVHEHVTAAKMFGTTGLLIISIAEPEQVNRLIDAGLVWYHENCVVTQHRITARVTSMGTWQGSVRTYHDVGAARS